MSPSELDTKAPSVPLHPFKVGDRVRRITDGVLKQYEVMKLSPRWKTDLFIREQSTGTEFWCNAESVQLDPGANEGKTIAPGEVVTTIQIIRADGKDIAAVTDWEAAAAVSRLQGRVWLLAAQEGTRMQRWYFDGVYNPSSVRYTPQQSAVPLGDA